MSPRIIAGIALAALLVGCADEAVRESGPAPEAPSPPVAAAPAAEPDTAPEPPDDPRPTPAEWTAGIVDATHDVTGAPLLMDVRVAPNEGFDRVVLEFAGEELPSYHIEYVDRPIRQCGSGDPVEIAGDGWLMIRLQPANAHDEQGNATVENRSFRPELPVIRELTIVCDFEAHVEWVVGVRSPNRYRVMELAEPARIVVDIRH